MSAAAAGLNQIFRMVFGTVLILVAGVTAVFGYVGVLSPFVAATETTHPAVAGDPVAAGLPYIVTAMLATMLVIAIWMISAPIRNDQRQEVR